MLTQAHSGQISLLSELPLRLLFLLKPQEIQLGLMDKQPSTGVKVVALVSEGVTSILHNH